MSNKTTSAIIVTGSPAVGKSTYAKKLAQEKSAVLLDLDTCTERLIQAGLTAANKDPNDRDSQYYKSTYRQVVYETLYDIARENLAHQNVIIVGPFTQELKDPSWPEFLQQRLAVKVEVHYLSCQPEIREQRMRERGNPRDLQKFQDWEKQNKYYLGDQRPVFECFLVDNSHPKKSMRL